MGIWDSLAKPQYSGLSRSCQNKVLNLWAYMKLIANQIYGILNMRMKNLHSLKERKGAKHEHQDVETDRNS